MYSLSKAKYMTPTLCRAVVYSTPITALTSKVSRKETPRFKKPLPAAEIVLITAKVVAAIPTEKSPAVATKATHA